ncbi:hypothetical protein PJ699_004708 [Klebsiella pneumoniae]|nr:hypothetical protein [Klebsiella pneumoniae]ELH4139422.1 hypothetical protein [Klebsiella pneumoniae]ELZ9401753.1 hypothetical protein [Klebsiella pneumoniae]
MFLMKSCEKEFNIKTLGSIRIGTLYGFRILENDEVRDILEGQYDYKISIKNSVMPIEVLGYLYKGIFSLEDFDYPYNTLSIRPNIRSAEGLIIGGEFQMFNHDAMVTNSQVILTSLHHNCFVFCMSLSSDIPLKPKFKGYDDFWFFSLDRRKMFSDIIKEKIRDCILTNPEEYGVIIENDNQLEIRASHDPIRYRRKNIDLNTSNVSTLIAAIKELDKIAFTKPLKYKDDNEYRFCFEVFVNGTPISITRPYIDIKMDGETTRRIFQKEE